MSEKSEKDLKEKQEETVEATPQEQASAETTVEAEEPTAEEKLQKSRKKNICFCLRSSTTSANAH